MQHKLKTYKDGFQNVEYCDICGAEGADLFTTACKPIGLKCIKCGHRRFTNIACSNCEEIQTKLKKAIDKHNSRN